MPFSARYLLAQIRPNKNEFILLLIFPLLMSSCSMESKLEVDEALTKPGIETLGPTLPKIVIDSVVVNENAGSMVFTVSLDAASSSPVAVDYAGAANTAQGAGVDYTLTTGTLTIAAGNTSGTITVNINNDSLDEANENFSVQLANPIGATIQTALGVGTITDDDPMPTLSINDMSASEGDGNMNLTVTLSAASGRTVTVDYAAGGGTATSGGLDYTLSAGTAVIAAGSTTASISISLNDDALVEVAENFVVTLSDPTNATISDATGIATITDNDLALGAFTISGITGTSDSTPDAYLNGGLNPGVTWGSSSNATSYDVTIYENDGTTIKCATQNTVSTSYDFSSCNLTAGSNYKAKVTAKAGAATPVDATNSLYAFNVNRAPTITSSGPWYVLSGGSIVIDAQYAAAPAVGTAQDADSDTLIFSAVGSASSGVGTATNNSTSITYSPSTYTGVETFSVTVSDGKGATVNGTMTIHVVTAKTWTGGTSNTWTNSTGGNWCGAVNTNKTGCTNAGTVPGASDVAIIDGTCSGPNCSPTVNYNVSIQGLKLSGSSSLTQNTGNTITIGSSGWIQSGGTFTGSNANVTYNGAFTLSGGSYTATSATTLTQSHLTISGSPTFNHNSGSFKFDLPWGAAAATLTPGNAVFNNYEFAGSNGGGSQRTLSGTMIVSGTLTLNGNPSWNNLINGGTISAKGNVNATNAGVSGSTLIKVDGNTNQTLTGISTSSFLSLEVASTGGTVTFNGTLLMRGAAFTYTSGVVEVGTSTLIFECLWSGGAKTISPGSLALNNVEFRGSNGGGNQFNLSGTMTVNGILTLNAGGGWNYLVSGGTISAKGNVNATNTGVSGSTLLRIDGNTNQTIAGVSTAQLLNLEIASTGGIVDLSGTLLMKNASLTYTSGVVDAGTSTLVFEVVWGGGAKTISSGGLVYNNVEFKGSNGGSDQFNLSGTMVVDGTLTLNASSSTGANLSAGGAITARGNLVLSNGGSSGSTLLTMSGSNSATISQVSGAHFPGSSLTLNKSGGSVVSLVSDLTLNRANQDLLISSETLNMSGFNLTVNRNLTNNGTLQRGTNPSCGSVTQGGSFSGTAAVCP